MASEAEGRQTNQDGGTRSDDHAEGNTDPGRDVPVDQGEGDDVGADTEEGRMAERQLTTVAGQDIPRHAERSPDRNQGQDQLVVAVGDEARRRQIGDRDDRQH
jgi:hypothetical protein